MPSATFTGAVHKRIESCRLCGHKKLDSILNLGDQSFTGLFPKKDPEKTPTAPLELVKCGDCHLVQLAHSFDPAMMYGLTYGYRSGLNASMVAHLKRKVEKVVDHYGPKKGDLIIDIGSNDATLLKSYPHQDFTLIGIDPSGIKFKDYYPPSVQLIPDFFSAYLIRRQVGQDRKAKVITSIAMFYDLEDPTGFALEVSDLLADDGVWVFEQSYLPFMLDQMSYDTVCHEHLEYYGLAQVKRILDSAGLKILDIEFNDVNGGSFSVTAAKTTAPYKECTSKIHEILADEKSRGLDTLEPYRAFALAIDEHRNELVNLVRNIKADGKKVFGYGASTKGNVLLQYCGFTADDIEFIAEVNEDKFGAFTPGTAIPIISEKDARAKSPDYFMVLPWHFRKGIIEREKNYLSEGGRILFPLPRVEVISS